ncbi:DUF1302 family protein [Azoarcus sp. L1K30]|uniref:DUF1302 family protein n=1 Tax=Azoarcus sp. L1K30 TaxID=2820277 RepID=UPI001B840997|nr:DUF1302 family protein [Azoarcus sp. L1K30]MBR0567473.1 DUF1302 family protein [Azoarcus sp. L1K30]
MMATSAMAAACLSGPGVALAADWSVSGFVRQEVAVKTSGDSNINNQQGNTYNGVTVPNTGLFGGSITRPASHTEDNTFNVFQTRIELNLDGRLSDNWSAHFKLRGIADEIGQVDDAFDKRNTFEQKLYASTKGTPLEANGRQWMLDLPVAYADYSQGPLWLRFGNQQIAWGEALFFRVSDVPNGLDLRRHSVLGVAAEEYADSRVPALGIRGSYRVTDDWEVEGFAQKFQASLLPGQNSPYNPIPAQFTIQERQGFDDARNNWNLGARVKGTLGAFDIHAFAVNRNNPDGVYKWTLAKGAGTLPGSAFQGGSNSGVFSAAEWFDYAAATRLDGLGALETALNEFPDTVALGANAVAAGCGAPSSAVGAIRVDQASGGCILDTFFTTGSLRGHLAREYPRETVVGFGINHVFEGEPDTLMDQLIGRFELSYTPDKKFTNPTLSRRYIEEDETQFAFIFEKYHKFSNAIPATYMVAQWLHKSASDLFGRSLVGVDNVAGERPRGQSGGFNAVAFALQQPSPTLAWRFDLTVLTDLKGGWLIQPGVKWKPNKDFQLDVYANVIESYGAQDNRNFAQGLEYANEVFARATVSF